MHQWNTRRILLYTLLVGIFLTCTFRLSAFLHSSLITKAKTNSPSTIHVPQDQPTIQDGIDAAADGDLVLVAPGQYFENVVISGKTITLASQFHTSGDRNFIDQTIIDGGGNPATITVNNSVGPDTKIIGFTIQNGLDGIVPRAQIEISNNRIINNDDGIDYEANSGGYCSNNVFENNSDDGIDLDFSVDIVIEGNHIQNNADDGIEIRLHAYSGPTINIVIEDNIISGNGEDGIQLIDYPNLSNRVFFIQRNLIIDNSMVGIGLMDNGISIEDFRAASIPERIHLFNNTLSGNPYAVTGGDNLIALNNIFINSSSLALKDLDGGLNGSVVAYNLFWNNNTDHSGSNIDTSTSIYADPLVDTLYHLQPGSPAVDTGIAQFEWNGETVLDIPPSGFSGVAPDLGKFELITLPSNEPPVVDAGLNQTITFPFSVRLDGKTSDDGLPNPPGSLSTFWTMVSGPGLVTFTDPNSKDTTASFSIDGIYVLRLTADDGEKTAFDEVTIHVNPPRENSYWLPLIVRKPLNRR